MEKTLGTMKGLQAQGLAVSHRICLDENELYQIERGQAGYQLKGLQGELWITVPGDVKDYLVSAGQTFQVPARKGVLVQAMTSASFALQK